MEQDRGTYVCPKGHASSEPDYCSACGARINGTTINGTTINGTTINGTTINGATSGALGSSGGALTGDAASGGNTQGAGESCPDCGTLREQAGVIFCEVCGFNFETGAHGEIPLPAEGPSAATPAQGNDVAGAQARTTVDTGEAAARWTALVEVDPSLRDAESPDPPSGVVPFSVMLDQPVSLIGRRNEARGIFPEIALPHDEAVSRRHALLQIDPQHGLLLRDIGAANGTRLNGKELQPMTDYVLHEGDQITLGHWTRITLQAS